MKKSFLFMSLWCICFSCQENTKEVITKNEKQNTKDTLQKKDTIKIHKKITFTDIKDKFLHKNIPLVPSPKDTNFYQMVSLSYGLIKTKGDLTQEEINALKLAKLNDYYNLENKRGKYVAYSLHNLRDGYLIGIVSGGEYATSNNYFRVDKNGNIVQYCFSLNSYGDGGGRLKDFAFFKENNIEIHKLYAQGDEVTYKKYNLNFSANFEMKADTLDRQFRKSYENDLFNEILKKYNIRF